MIDQMETNIFNNAITINGGISEHINNFWGGHKSVLVQQYTIGAFYRNVCVNTK